jgi:ActR/RegA family two-component response regulator
MTSAEEFSAQEITILLVEDDPPTLWRLQDALVRAGFDVAAAATLGEARASCS